MKCARWKWFALTNCLFIQLWFFYGTAWTWLLFGFTCLFLFLYFFDCSAKFWFYWNNALSTSISKNWSLLKHLTRFFCYVIFFLLEGFARVELFQLCISYIVVFHFLFHGLYAFYLRFFSLSLHFIVWWKKNQQKRRIFIKHINWQSLQLSRIFIACK